MTNTITILGSTGSIGRQSLDVAEQLGLRVAALTANTNVERGAVPEISPKAGGNDRRRRVKRANYAPGGY